MTDENAPDPARDDARSGADELIRELQAFTEQEADDLDALAAELAAVRSTLPAPAFDRDAIWARIGGRLSPPPAPEPGASTD
jgi:hypothetical protein